MGDGGSTSTGANPVAKPVAAPPRAKAIGGFRLGIWALLHAIGRFFRRLFGTAPG